MKKFLSIAIVLLVVFGIFGQTLPTAKAAMQSPAITVTPTTCDTVAQYVFNCQNNAQFDEIQIAFPVGFFVPATIPTTSVFVTGTSVSSVTVSGNTVIIKTSTYPSFPPTGYYNMQVTIYATAGIKNPPCASCGPQTITMSSLLATVANGSLAFQFNVASKPSPLGVFVDPPLTNDDAIYDIGFTVGVCGALTAGSDTVTITFPAGTVVPFSIAANQIWVARTTDFTSRSCPPTHAGVLGTDYAPISTALTSFGGKVTFTIPISVVASGTVYVLFCRTAGIKNPFSANYYKVSVNTSRELFIADTPQYMIGNHPKVTVTSNAALAGNVEYKIEWQLHYLASLSGANSDWIEVNWYYPTNPAPDNASISNVFPPAPAASSVTLQNFNYGTIYYATAIQGFATKTIRIMLPAGFTIQQGGTVVITFLGAAGLINTVTPGGYRLQMSHSKAPEPIPSDMYSIVDAVTFDTPGTTGVFVEPPTVSAEAQYTIAFKVGTTAGAMSGGSGTITIAFPTYSSIPFQIGAGSVWLVKGAAATDVVFDPDVTCPPVMLPPSTAVPVPLSLNPTVSGLTLTITLPPGFNVANGDYVGIRFCRSAGLRNPATAGSYTLQIKTSAQPNYAISPPYLITTTVTNLAVTPTPNAACSSRVQYEIKFNVGASGSLQGNAGDYIEVDFDDPSNPGPDQASIQNTFDATTAVTATNAYVSPPFTGINARWDMWFNTGTALAIGTSTVTIIFPPTVILPSSFPANTIYMSTAQMELTDAAAPGAPAAAVTTVAITGQRVTLTCPVAFPAGSTVYIRFRNMAGIANPTAPNASNTLQLLTTGQPYPVPAYFGITNDYQFTPTGTPPSVDPQWNGHVLGLVPTVFPSTVSVPAQYDLALTTGATCAIAPASTLVIEFPQGTVLPSTVPANTIRVQISPAPPGYLFGPDIGCAGGVAVTAVSNPTARTLTLSGMPAIPGGTTFYVRICQSVGVRNPSVPSVTTQLNVTLNGTGCLGDGLSVLSEFYVITPPPIGGIGIPPNSVRLGGAYYYSGYTTSFINHIDVIGPKTLRLWLPPNALLQSSQQVSIIFTDVAGLVNTCFAGTYTLKLRTSKELTWVTSAPYSIVDAVRFTCGTYPIVMPPTVGIEAQYDISFTVGPAGGLQNGVDKITVSFPSYTILPYNMSAGSIYVSTLPITTDGCPPGPPATAVTFPPQITGSTVTFTTPIPIGNSQTVYVRFCKSAGVKNPYTAGNYTLQVKTSKQPEYAVSCEYGIGTAIGNVNVKVSPNAACNTQAQYEVSFTLGTSGQLKGENSDYVDVDFDEPSNINGPSIQNDFLIPSQRPTASSIIVSPFAGAYGYGAHNASMVVALSSKKLRIYVSSTFIATNGATVTVIFTPGSGLINTCTPGSYKLLIATSQEQALVPSKPYDILDAVVFDPSIPVDVVPPTVSKEAQYTITFRNGPTATLPANSGTISIAFPIGTYVPYSIAPGTVWIARGTLFTNNTCPPTHAGALGVDYKQLTLPPQVSGNIITMTTPITINPGEYVQIRFCKTAAIKNPATAGSYTLQVKTSAQPAYATSYPYAITSAISNIKVTPTPNTACAKDVEYKIEFQNSTTGSLSGDLGDYIEVDFNDPTNPAPDYASISNIFTATNAISNLRVMPLSRPVIGLSPRVDVSFRVGATGALNPGSTVTLNFPANMAVGAPAVIAGAGAYLSTAPWTRYEYEGQDCSFTSAGTVATLVAGDLGVVGTSLTITIPVGFSIANNSYLYIRLCSGGIQNPSVAGQAYVITASTSLQPIQISSNYLGAAVDRPPGTIPASSVDLNDSAFVSSPRVLPTEARANSQLDVSMLINCALVTPPSSITLSLPIGFSVPSSISSSNIYLSVFGFLDNNEPPANPGVFGVHWGNPTVAPTVVGNTITFPIPAFLQPLLVFGSTLYVRIAKSANVRNPAIAGTTYAMSVATFGSDPCGFPGYGVFADSEYMVITPEINPVGASTISPSSITLSQGYGGYGAVYPSSVLVLGPKRLRLYLPLGFTIGGGTTATITFLPSSKLNNTCTPGNYILKLLTSKEPTDIASNPYTIVATVSNINVRAVPPIVSTKSNYTIVFKDTSTIGLQKDLDKITIAFPSGTIVPTMMAYGAIYVARSSDFSNDVCPPTHPGVFGVDYASLNGPPTVSGQQVTITVPINITAGDLIVVRFCESAGITNPPTAGYYTLQVKTSVQPDYAVSNPYPIVTGAQRPKVTVEPNVISRAPVPGCTKNKTTITFQVGTTGALTKNTSRIFVTLELAPLITSRGYFALPAFIPANSIMINGVVCTVDAIVNNPPVGSRIPNPKPSFTSMVTLEIVTPVDVLNSQAVKIEFLDTSGICNPYVAGNYTVAVWTDVETAAIESEPYSIVDGVWVVYVDVQPPTICTAAQYTIKMVPFAALTQGVSTITVTFPSDTTVPTTMLPGHIMLDNDEIFGPEPGDLFPPKQALMPTTVSGRSVTFTMPFDFPIGGSLFIRFSVESGIKNPCTEGAYKLKIRTSSQLNDAESPPYNIVAALGGIIVTVNPPVSKFINAEYTIDFDLSSKGPLTAHVSFIKITFPNNDITGTGGGYAAVGSTLPSTIAPSNITINDAVVTEAPSVSVADRTIEVISPISIAASSHVKLVIRAAAGMNNPITGSYRIMLHTSVEPIDVQSAIYTITSALGGPLAGRNPIVNVSYVVSTLTAPANTGDVTLFVDQTLGWVDGAYGLLGDLGNFATSQVVRVTGIGAGTLAIDPLYPVGIPRPLGTNIFMLKSLQASTLPPLPAVIAGGVTQIDVVDARPFVGETYCLIGPLNATAELLRIASVDILLNRIYLAQPTVNNHANTEFVFKFANNIGLVNNEAYYAIQFQTGGTGSLSAQISTVTITFPFDTTTPSSIPPDAIKVSVDGIVYYSSYGVVTDPTKRTVTITMPVAAASGDVVRISILPRAGIRNPSMPGTYRLKIRTSTELTDIDSLSYYMEGTGAPQVSVDPCTNGEVGAIYKIKFRITVGLPLNGHIFITFPQDTVLPSVLRQENVMINGMKVVAPITVTTATLTVDITSPKSLLASEEVVVEFTPEARIKNPSSPGMYRLKVRTNQTPDNVDVDSMAYYICPKINLGSVILIPSALTLSPGQTGTIQVQAKDENGNNITFNVSYIWSTDIGTLSGTTGDSATITAPSTPGNGTVTCKATYQGKTLSGTCAVTITAPLGSVTIEPVGPITMTTSAQRSFSAQAKDTTGATVSGATLRWTITGGIGSVTPITGALTTVTAAATPSTGSLVCEATYAGVTKTASVTIQVQELPGGGGGGGGGSELTIQASIQPGQVALGEPLNLVTIGLRSLKDLTGGEIRITIPTGWSPPTAGNIRIQFAEGVQLGTLSFAGQMIVIPVTSMTIGKTFNILYQSPNYPQQPATYTFPVTAKGSTGEPIAANPQPTLAIAPAGTGGVADGSGICTVTPSTASAGSTGARFQFTFTARADMSNGEVRIQIPLDWTPPTDSPGNKGQVSLKNTEGEISAIQYLPGGVISVLLGKFLNNQKFTLEYANVEVPSFEKTYTFTVQTAGKGGTPKPIGNQPTVDVAKTQISNVTCTPKPNSAGGTAQYQISFRTSEAGTLIKDLSIITIQFPSDTTLAPTMAASSIKVQGVPLISPPSINQSSRSIMITCPTDVAPNQTCVIVVEIDAGVKNPTQPRSNYRLTMWTSSDASPTQSNSYNIEASTVTPAKVTPDPVVVAVEAQYTIVFKTGGSGRLSIGDDQVVIKFPNDTLLPPNINATSVTINGKQLTKRPSIDNVARKIALYLPEPVLENANVTIIFDKNAGLRNPTKAGNYTLFVSTTKETIEIESEAYGIGSSSVANVKVTPSSNNAGSTCVDYTIEFVTGQFGALSPASTITIWFHPNYKLGSIESRRVTVNNMGIVETPEVKQGQYITFKVPAAINAGSQVKVLIQCLDNPTTAGSYFVKAYTSAEPTQIQSNNYSLGETLITTLTLAPPNPNGDNGWYNTKPSIVLSCNINTARTYYKIDDAQAQLYTGSPVQIGDGTHRIEYWSEAAGYDKETPQTITNLRVDTVRPEITVTSPKAGITVTEQILEIKGNYVEDNIFQITVAVGLGGTPSALTVDKTSKTFTGKIMLTKGLNQLDIKAIDEAGNVSLIPVIPVTFDPNAITKLEVIVLNPKEGEQALAVNLVNEATPGNHHIQMKVNVQGTATGEVTKVEISSEVDPTNWVTVPYDSVKKNFNGDVNLRCKAGSCKITVKVTDKNGNTEVATKTLRCAVKLEFIGIKGYHTVNDVKAKKAIMPPNRSMFNGNPITNLSAYPFLSEEGKTYAPFRFVGNAFGAKVSYIDASRTAVYEFEGKRVELVQGSNKATIVEANGTRRTIQLDANAAVTAKNVNGSLFVPVKFFESVFGWKAVYDSTTRTVTVTFP